MINIIPPLEQNTNKAQGIIKTLLTEPLNMNQFSWQKGLNYRDFILAVWRTLLKQENTKLKANLVNELIGQEKALKLISDQINIES